MGAILAKYYEYIQQKAGFPGKVELAKLTKTPQVLAATQPDTPEAIQKFRNAVAKITGAAPPIF